MKYKSISFSGHAVKRMFERSIEPEEVEFVLRQGKVIAAYPDDTPYPSCLMLGFVRGQPLHVVVALEENSQTCYIITVYHPDPALWEAGFEKRRSV